MAVVSGPLMSIEASGAFGKALVFSKWKSTQVCRKYVIPTYSNTTDQVNIRLIISDASFAWKNSSTVNSIPVNSDYKNAYNESASGMNMSGFNLFIKECVAKNGGTSYSGTLKVPSEPGDVTP